ncbi:DinB family protein [Robertkochia marina]|uniref:DinB family protein n=1 Tax=Robertkochia marina TaxID=1227945 RepID=A0A4S3M0Q1_9FLAO|nr:DinB family protein [Robertkochia marina]THD67954.1 DinB family protein [Robertkochia marina]TRZ41547.1 DinB family protein [Robertkochia marina]
MNIKELQSNEYGKFYEGYIKVLGDVDLMSEFKARTDAFNSLFERLNEKDLHYSYAQGKWTIAELILHIIDAERVFQYRALRIGRGDTTDLPGYDQDIFVPNCNASERTLSSLQIEFGQVRSAGISLFENFPQEALLRLGTASGEKVSVRALGFMICGHQKHHENILRERYLRN